MSFWHVLKEDLNRDIYHADRLRKAELLAEAKARKLYNPMIEKASNDSELNEVWNLIDEDLIKLAQEVAEQLSLKDYVPVLEYVRNQLFSGKREFKKTVAAFTADTEFGKLRVNLEEGAFMGAREYDGQERMYYVTVMDGDKIVASIPFVSEDGNTPPEAQVLYDQLEHNQLSNWPPELKYPVEQAAFAREEKMEKEAQTPTPVEELGNPEAKAMLEAYAKLDKKISTLEKQLKEAKAERQETLNELIPIVRQAKGWIVKVGRKTFELAHKKTTSRSYKQVVDELKSRYEDMSDEIDEIIEEATTRGKRWEMKISKKAGIIDKIKNWWISFKSKMSEIDNLLSQALSKEAAEMTKVVNLRTGEERIYDLSPNKAVVNAYEQEQGNNNFWNYDYSKAKKSKSGKTWSCGDWTALARKESGINPHCPNCGSLQLKKRSGDNYTCNICNHKFKYHKDGTYEHIPDLETKDTVNSAGFGPARRSKKRINRKKYSKESQIDLTSAIQEILESMGIDWADFFSIYNISISEMEDNLREMIEEYQASKRESYSKKMNRKAIRKSLDEGDKKTVEFFVNRELLVSPLTDEDIAKTVRTKLFTDRADPDFVQAAIDYAIEFYRKKHRKRAQTDFQPTEFMPTQFGPEAESSPGGESKPPAKKNKSYHTREEIERWFSGSIPKRDSVVKDYLGNIWRFIGPAGPDTYEIELVEEQGPSPDDMMGGPSAFNAESPIEENDKVPTEKEQLEIEEGEEAPLVEEEESPPPIKTHAQITNEAVCKNCRHYRMGRQFCDFWNSRMEPDDDCEMFEPARGDQRPFVEKYVEAPAMKDDRAVVGMKKKTQLDAPAMKLIELYNEDPEAVKRKVAKMDESAFAHVIEEIKKAEGTEEISKFLDGLWNQRFGSFRKRISRILPRRKRRKKNGKEKSDEVKEKPFYNTDAPRAYQTPKPKKDDELPNKKIRMIPIPRISKEAATDKELVQKVFQRVENDPLLKNETIDQIKRFDNHIEVTFIKKAQYYSSIDEMAEELVKKPSNYAPSSDAPEDFYENWALVNLASRDSGLLEQANAEIIEKEMEEFGEDQVIFGSASHWAFGYMDTMWVKIRDESGNYTPAFRKLYEINQQLSDYAILDEEAYSQKQYDAQLESIRFAAIGEELSEDAPEDWEKHVFSWLWDNNQEALEDPDDTGYVDEDAVIEALRALGWLEEE